MVSRDLPYSQDIENLFANNEQSQQKAFTEKYVPSPLFALFIISLIFTPQVCPFPHLPGY